MCIEGTEANDISYCIFVQTREPLAILITLYERELGIRDAA